MHILYSIKGIDETIHDKIMNEKFSSVCKYSTCVEDAWRVAEKVNLFESIIIVKKRNSNVWVAYKKGFEQPFLFGGEDREIDFLNLKPVAFGNSFPETICKASLILKSESNERTKSSDQYGSSLFEKVDS